MSTSCEPEAQKTAPESSDIIAIGNKSSGKASCESPHETYGSDTLPVLVQLPDLRAVTAVPTPVPASVVTLSVDDANADEAKKEAEPIWQSPVHERREQRRQRAQIRSAESSRWLRKAGNFLTAVVLASSLFAIIVAVKQWNGKTPDGLRPADAGRVDGPEIDFGTPRLDLPPHLMAGEGERLPSFETSLEQLDPAKLLGVGADPDTTDALVEGANGLTAPESIAPEPIVPATMPPFYPTGEDSQTPSVPKTARRPIHQGWHEAAPMGGVRQAERPGPQYRSPTR